MAHTLVCERAAARCLHRAEVPRSAIHTRAITGVHPSRVNAGERTGVVERTKISTRRGRLPFRAITDDDLLRFFAVCETAGMLG
jgi:hypothetical protein